MNKKKTILYVNFSPYENTGYILDFLVSKFDYVYLFSFEHYRLNSSRSANSIHIYKKSKKIDSITLSKVNVPQSLVFALLPLRSLITFFQLLRYSYQLNKQYGSIDYFFSVNAYTAWIGNILRSTGLVKHTVFWIWDYYPPTHKNKIIQLMRQIYWYFDKKSTESTKLYFLNSKLIKLRKQLNLLNKNEKYEIIPIGTKPSLTKKQRILSKNKHLVIGFIGVLKQSQGLELMLKSSPKLLQSFRLIELKIIGDGPDREYFEILAKKSNIKTTFYGLLSEEIPSEQKRIEEILQSCDIGIATYIPEKSNVSYYGDPSKIKRYLSVGLPIITTNVFEFSNTLATEKAGLVIPYKSTDFVNAIKKITQNYSAYQSNSRILAKKYNYKIIYKNFFK